MPNYKEIPALISNRTPFKGNSVSGHLIDNGALGDDYEVWSYSTKIASTNDFFYGQWWISPDTYSKTTSRIQNIVREIARIEGYNPQ